MSLDFLPSGSSVTFTLEGWAFDPAKKVWLDHTDFPDGYTGEVRIDAGTRATVRIGMKIHIFEDNWIDNEELDQSVFVDWVVSAAPDGKLTIEPNPKIWRGVPSSGSIKAGLTDINPWPLLGDNRVNHVRINPVIASGGGTAGISMVVGVSENVPPQSVSVPFTLTIGVDNIPPAEEPEIEISKPRTHKVRFPKPKFRNGRWEGQHTVLSEQITEFNTWYMTLNETTRKRIESGDLTVELTAYASTTGTIAYNMGLAKDRNASVEELLKTLVSSDVEFERNRARGELETPTPDEVEDAEWRKVVIKVFDVISE